MTQPTLLGRVYAWLQDEVPATVLEAYRRASLPVFEVMDLAEARRLECATEDLNPWTVPPAVRAELLCAWNAFVLQTLGNDILDADYDDSPATAGYVPPFTVHQVLAFYAQVEEWLTRARQAHANPDIRRLTDPEARTQLQHVPQALNALLRMWRLDPDPARTRAIHAEIQSALNRGEIAYASNGSERLGYFHCCPWSAIYVVNRPVNLGGRRLEPMQGFVYNVGALDPADGFKRGILFGNFQETGDLEYGPHRPRDAGG
jgi:hypothetical protein